MGTPSPPKNKPVGWWKVRGGHHLKQILHPSLRNLPIHIMYNTTHHIVLSLIICNWSLKKSLILVGIEKFFQCNALLGIQICPGFMTILANFFDFLFLLALNERTYPWFLRLAVCFHSFFPVLHYIFVQLFLLLLNPTFKDIDHSFSIYHLLLIYNFLV